MGDDPIPRLARLPAAFSTTVAALHRVAEEVISPARKPQNEIALSVTPGGFGTPVFDHAGVRHQVRVEGADLVHRVDDEDQRAALTSLATARRLVADLLPAGGPPSDEPLDIDPVAAARLADWYAFGAAILRDLAAIAATDDAPTPAQLWPEHFDLAIELGSESAGRRATYGFSPGDEQQEPYAYVAPWAAEVAGELWTADGFRGAQLGYGALMAARDQRAAALDFFITRRQALA